MSTVDVFGKSKKKATAVIKILSNGGLSLINDFVSVRLDPNNNNILSLSANGLMVDGIKRSQAATKYYVDNRTVNNTSGFIPPLHSNESKQGFMVSASSEFDTRYPAWGAFSNTHDEWVTKSIQVNSYIQIKLPFPIAIWAFALRGRSSGSERWFKWLIEGSNDGEIWIILYSTTSNYLGNKTKIYKLEPGMNNKYIYYRFYGIKSEPTNPGLSYMQIYSIDNLHNK